MFSRVSRTQGARKRRKMAHESSPSVEEEISVIQPKTTIINEQSPTERPPATVEDIACKHKKELGMLKDDIGVMQELITCRVCQRFLSEPYGLACGHTYCYICLDTWLVAQKKNSCPECRAVISEQPVPSLIIRDLVAIFSSRAALIPDGETLEDLARNAKEGAETVAKDKAEASDGQPFKGIFSNVFSGRRRGLRQSIWDSDDNVHRCPDCFHELEHGVCTGCGECYAVEHDSFDEDDLDLDDFDDDVFFDPQRMRDNSTMQIMADMNRRRRRDARGARQARGGSISSNTDTSEDDDEHDPEMDNFIVPDDDVESGSDSDGLSESEGDGRAPFGDHHHVYEDSWESEEETDARELEGQRYLAARAARTRTAEARRQRAQPPAYVLEVSSDGADSLASARPSDLARRRRRAQLPVEPSEVSNVSSHVLAAEEESARPVSRRLSAQARDPTTGRPVSRRLPARARGSATQRQRVQPPVEPVEVSDDSEEETDGPISRRRRKTTRSTPRRPVAIDLDSEDEEESDGQHADTGPGSNHSGFDPGSAQGFTVSDAEDDNDSLADENGMTFNDLIAGRINNDLDPEGDQHNVEW